MTTIKTEVQQTIEEITKNLTNPGYFLSNRPFFYNADDYFASCGGQKTSKMLESEWLTVVIPSLKVSNIKVLSDAGVRLEKQWKLSGETRRQRSEDGYSVKMRKLMKSSLYQHRKAVLDHSGETMRDDLHALGSSLSYSLTQPWSSAYTPPYQLNPDSRELLTFSLPSPPELTARNETINQQEAHAFFTSAGSLQDVLLSNLSEGHTLPQWAKSRPSYTFKLQLQDDWGSRITELYGSAKTKVHLNHNHIDEIALLSGILHLNKTHIGFSAKEISKIHNDVVRTFYSKEMEDKDIERAQDAATMWANWTQKWKSIILKEKLAAESEGRDLEAVNAEPVVDAIMSSYSECKTKKIMLILFIALHVFRRYNNWAALTSESDCMMAVVGPILQEIMDIQHIIRFTCSNTSTSAGKHRKTKLQEGQSRQPDIIGKTNEKQEVFYGELKGLNPTTASVNTDLLRLAIFSKNSLDQLHSTLEQVPPLLTFQAVGRDVTFFLGAKINNTIVHVRLSSIKLPSLLSELDMDQEFFFHLLRVQSIVNITKDHLKNKREQPLQEIPFPTLGTLERDEALHIPQKNQKDTRQ